MFDTSKFSVCEYKKGQRIFNEGDMGTCAYLIKYGKVNIYKIIDGQKIIFVTLGKNQIFGEMAVISAEPRSASAEAFEDSELMEIDEKRLDATLRQGNVIVKAITQQLIQRFREKDKLVTTRTSNNIFLSMSHLIHLMHSYHPNELGYGLFCKRVFEVLSVSQLEVNSILKWLRKHDLLEIEAGKRKRLRIPEPDSFLRRVEALEEQKPFPSMRQEQAYIDVLELAKMTKTTPFFILQKIKSGQIPVDMLFFSLEKSKDWIERYGAQLVKKTSPKGSSTSPNPPEKEESNA